MCWLGVGEHSLSGLFKDRDSIFPMILGMLGSFFHCQQ